MNKKIEKELQKLIQEEEHIAKKLEKLEEQKRKILEKSYKEIIDYFPQIGIHNIEKKYILGGILYVKAALDEKDRNKLDELEKLSNSLLRPSKRRSSAMEVTDSHKKDISNGKKDAI